MSSAGASGLGGSGVRPEPQTRTSLTAVTAKASHQATPAERLEGELHKVPELARRAKPALARLLRRVNRRCSAFRRRSVGEACVDGPSLARSGGGFFGRAFACVHVSGLLMQPRLLAKMASAGGRSKQSSDLDRPLLRAVYLPLRIERSRPSSFLLQARQRRARMSFRTRRSRQAAAIALPPACA